MATFVTIPNQPRQIKATEARLNKIYEAARMGLRGDNLAVAAGMSPEEYRLLSDMDHMVKMVEMQARADAELTHSRKLHEASLAGDTKASLAILQHQHGWTDKQAASVIDGGITIVIGAVESPYKTIEGEVLGRT